jgi:hypothetical protein
LLFQQLFFLLGRLWDADGSHQQCFFLASTQVPAESPLSSL